MAFQLASLLTATIALMRVDSVRIDRQSRVEAARRQDSGYAFGANYGSRFIPEAWMFRGDPLWSGVYAQSPQPGETEPRLALSDLGEARFRERMVQYLDRYVVESDFVKMVDLGVDVLRVPCGYWNWISYAPGQGPNAPANESARMQVLTSLPPATYRPYFDKIFQWADRYGIRILLDLHSLPGSQNGEQTAGICIETPYWNTDWNIQKSVETVSAMAEYCADKASTLYGLQVINEPNSHHFNGDYHSTLDSYYDQAIRAARNYLAWDVPVIVFEWVSRFNEWPNDRFSQGQYGTVMWDTHIYQAFMQVTYDLQATQDLLWGEMLQLEEFNNRQSGGAMVGEWSLAGTEYWDTYGGQPAEAYRNLSSWVVWCFLERSNGAFFWSFDIDHAQWGYEKASSEWNIDWKNMPKPGTPPTPTPPRRRTPVSPPRRRTPVSPPRRRTSTPQPTPGPLPGPCSDDSQFCEDWAASGECETNPGYMLGACRESCGVCSPSPPCFDDSQFCEDWAASGECETNPGYMLESCRESCGVCSPTSGPQPTPSPSGGCCRFGAECADCGDDGTGWCHQSASNCAQCTGIFDPSGLVPVCR